MEHQLVLRSLPERPHQESPQASPSQNLAHLRCEVIDQLPSTVNTVRGAGTKTGHIPDLGRPPIIKGDTFEDISADAKTPMTPQRQAQFVEMATSTPCSEICGTSGSEDPTFRYISGALHRSRPVDNLKP